MKDKASFDDVEAREVVTTPIDGLTDEAWAARNERQGRVIRRTVSILVGLAVGVAAAALFGDSPLQLLAKWLVTIGSALLAFGLAEREAREPGARPD
ncbi:MAG TPA: hypothetical protein VGI57_14930 [Usitatibacter sp.]